MCATLGYFYHAKVSFVDYVTPIPEGIDSAAATPILCAVRLARDLQEKGP